MPKSYKPAPADVLDLLDEVKAAHHPDLIAADVRIGVLMVLPPLDKEGEPTGPALKVPGQGCAATALVKINPVEKRAQGLPDVTILIARDEWNNLEPAERRAVIDHELTHCQVKEGEPIDEIEDGPDGKPRTVVRKQYKRDEAGYLALRLREHDIFVGGFKAIVERHGRDSIEAQAVAGYARQYTQKLFGWADDMAPQDEGPGVAEVLTEQVA